MASSTSLKVYCMQNTSATTISTVNTSKNEKFLYFSTPISGKDVQLLVNSGTTRNFAPCAFIQALILLVNAVNL